MSLSSPKQRNKGKGSKNETGNFSSPHIWLPGHLSAWPDVKMSKLPIPTSKSKSDMKSTGTIKSGAITAETSRPSQEQNHLHKQGCTNEDTKKKDSLSLSDDEEDSTTATSSTDSQYQSADEDSFAKQRSGSNLTRKMDELSSGSDCELSDDGDSNTKANSSQFTPEEGASERKDVLKDATASQKRDKTTGRKKNQDKGGSENVFNARSPDKEMSDTIDRTTDATSTKTPKHSHRQGSPVSSFLITLSKDLLGPQDQSLNAFSSKSPAKLRTNLSETDSPKNVPVRSRPSELSQSKQNNFQPTAKFQTTQENTAAVTEAQRRANLLQRRGQREFSSNAFDVSDDGEDNGSDIAEKSGSKVKGKKKKKAIDLHYNPVVAEIAKQQARLKEHSAKKMKENPERYLKNEDRVYELSSEDEVDQVGSSHVVGAEKNSRARDAAAPSPSSREKSYDQSVTKKDKKKKKDKKRKRDRDTDGVEEDDHRDRKRKRSKEDDQDEVDERRSEKQFDEFLSDLQRMVAVLTKALKDKPIPAKITSLQETINDYKAIKDLAKANSDNSPAMLNLNYHKAKHDAEISTVLKSLWPILPKAILHATMRNLNKANRASLQQKLQLCLKGKQTNPNIRVVEGVDRYGDKVDLLEEYGVISEPDPHTMSSDITLLTAAKSLIVLLSGERIGLDLSAIVEGSIKGEEDSLASGLKERTKDPSSAISPLEQELRRIADERLKEVDQLREENRILKTRLNKTK